MTIDLPALDVTRCTGSALCVAVCPADCLALANGRPWMPRPADCIGCSVCVLICPTEALVMAPPPTEK
jgi:NAD-dependent dihydropyrimidine dehydrogenase PreA subunit